MFQEVHFLKLGVQQANKPVWDAFTVKYRSNFVQIPIWWGICKYPLVTYAWKVGQYGELPSDGTVFWSNYGFEYYEEWKANRQASEQIP